MVRRFESGTEHQAVPDSSGSWPHERALVKSSLKDLAETALRAAEEIKEQGKTLTRLDTLMEERTRAIEALTGQIRDLRHKHNNTVATQTQNVRDIADSRAQIQGLEKALSEAQKDRDAIRTLLEGIAGRVAAAEKTIESIAGDVSGIRKLVKVLNGARQRSLGVLATAGVAGGGGMYWVVDLIQGILKAQ